MPGGNNPCPATDDRYFTAERPCRLGPQTLSRPGPTAGVIHLEALFTSCKSRPSSNQTLEQREAQIKPSNRGIKEKTS